ncbi:hypothetical protein DER44DRAFT_844699 [Fusarium oxysporum]|nr:hypothetical protein DER44DRAFT_844699 [Fusarium oxysporum]
MKSSSFKPFVTSLSKFFNTKCLSDAVIRCGDREFAVHSLILFSHSEYFAKQLDGPWKESSERAIDITDFDPDVPAADTSAMIFHAKVYQIGDKYGIKALKSYVTGKFHATIGSSWNTDDFPIAITLAYATTPSDDMGLRDSIVEIAFKNFESLISQTGFCETLREVGDFGFDLARFLYGKRSPEISRLNCPHCSHLSDLSSPMYPNYCPRCGSKVNQIFDHTTVLPH